MFEIIDKNGTLFSGSESEMYHIFDILINPTDYKKKEVKEYMCEWSGDLRLIQIHSIF